MVRPAPVKRLRWKGSVATTSCKVTGHFGFVLKNPNLPAPRVARPFTTTATIISLNLPMRRTIRTLVLTPVLVRGATVRHGTPHVFLAGIIPNSFAHIFGTIAKAEGSTKFLVRCSYLEIYCEDVRDLLGKDQTKRLQVKENPDKGVLLASSWFQPLASAGLCLM